MCGLKHFVRPPDVYVGRPLYFAGVLFDIQTNLPDGRAATRKKYVRFDLWLNS